MTEISAKSSALWQSSFASSQQNSILDEQKQALIVSYDVLCTNIDPILSQIQQVLPNLTVHSIDHSNQLWHVASEIVGKNYKINPLEAFILGASFLLHDAALALFAYDSGLEGIRSREEYKDAKAYQRNALRNTPDLSENEIDDTVDKRALFETLRRIHASESRNLLIRRWKHPRDASMTMSLIEDVALVSEYGALIGQISASHDWPISAVVQNFSVPITPSARFPAWSVHPLKLACILRCADAAAIDERRAPAMLAALSRPSGLSGAHWAFQLRLRPAHRPDGLDALLFQSISPFDRDQMDAWWLAYDAINMADRELRDSSRALKDASLPDFAAQRIIGASDPQVLAKSIHVNGWTPVDTAIRINDPAKLASLLGGTHLYGNDSLVPMRELVLNAADAIRARKELDPDFTSETNSLYPGRIELSIVPISDTDDHYIFIDDNGVGMSESVMTGPLVTFGKPFWTDSALSLIYPGLASSPSFRPAGKFGLGFFSVFMISDEVSIISRQADFASNGEVSTPRKVLSFRAGLNSRAELRNYSRSLDGSLSSWISTRVKLRVGKNFLESVGARIGDIGSIFGAENKDTRSLLGAFGSHLLRLVTALDVPTQIITPDENFNHEPHYSTWSENKLGELLLDAEWYLTAPEIWQNQLSLLSDLKSVDGACLGRVALSIHDGKRCLVLYSIGGIVTERTDDLELFGIVEASPDTASRSVGTFIPSAEQMLKWAEDQILKIKSLRLKDAEIYNAIVSAGKFGAAVPDWAVVPTVGGFFTIEKLAEKIQNTGVVVIPYMEFMPNNQRTLRYELKTKDGAAVNTKDIMSPYVVVYGTERNHRNHFPVLSIGQEIISSETCFLSRLLEFGQKIAPDIICVDAESLNIGTYVGIGSERDKLRSGGVLFMRCYVVLRLSHPDRRIFDGKVIWQGSVP